ncbi:hypothetical protein GCM10010399_55300 [Dactylosporangium fulvum]
MLNLFSAEADLFPAGLGLGGMRASDREPQDSDRPMREPPTLAIGRLPTRHGLGLSIVDAVASARGTVVTACAGTGGGLSVEVTFPAVRDESLAVPPAIR